MSMTTHPPMPGTGELYALLDFLNRKDEYKAKLDELERLRQVANDTVSLIGKAQQIPGLHKEAEEDREAAKRELSEARAEAKRVKDTAAEKASKAVADAEAKAAEILAAAMKEDEDIRSRAATVRKAFEVLESK